MKHDQLQPVHRDFVGAVFDEDVRARLFAKLEKLGGFRDAQANRVDRLEQLIEGSSATSDEKAEFELLAKLEARMWDLRARILAPRAPQIPQCWGLSDEQKHCYRAFRATMDAYFEFAYAKGMFATPENLLGRLRSDDNEQYWQAYAECMGGFALESDFGLKLELSPESRNTRSADFRTSISGIDYHVEIKAPLIIEPFRVIHEIKHHERIAQLLEKANKQIPEGSTGIVVFCPKTNSFPVERRAFVRALIGARALRISLNPESYATESQWVFQPCGSFLKPHSVPEGGFKAAYTRVSGVVVVFEECYPRLDCLLPGTCHRYFALENPGANVPFPRDAFSGIPLLQYDGESLSWNDGLQIY